MLCADLQRESGMFSISALWNFRSFKAAKCSHRTKRRGPVRAFGKTIRTTMPKNKDGSVDWCLDCLGKMAIRCAWCGHPIFVGDPITLYTPSDKNFKTPDYAVVYKKEPLTLVGCLGWNCADTGADRAGFWVPGNDGKGMVERVPTAFELMAQNPGHDVIINNAGDPKEARNPTIFPIEQGD